MMGLQAVKSYWLSHFKSVNFSSLRAAEIPGDCGTCRNSGKHGVKAGDFYTADTQPVAAMSAPGVLDVYPGAHAKFVVLVMLPLNNFSSSTSNMP